MENVRDDPPVNTFTAFVEGQIIARGSLAEVARLAHGYEGGQPNVLDDANGRTIDLDLRGSADEAVARVSSPPKAPKLGRGRPSVPTQ